VSGRQRFRFFFEGFVVFEAFAVFAVFAGLVFVDSFDDEGAPPARP
jgi:hypothetical protein